MQVLGHQLAGNGPRKVIVLHDYFSDCSSYEHTFPYWNQEAYQYAFVDLRGYGRSMGIPGEYTAKEMSEDVLRVADYLDWKEFTIVAHSMSGLPAQRLAIDAPERVRGILGAGIVPACGFPEYREMRPLFEQGARGDWETGMESANFATGGRYDVGVLQYKLDRFFKTTLEEARLGYIEMFLNTDFSAEAQGVTTPIQLLYGEFESELHKPEHMQKTFMQWYPNAEMNECPSAGHYPMQETPPYYATLLMRFLTRLYAEDKATKSACLQNT